MALVDTAFSSVEHDVVYHEGAAFEASDLDVALDAVDADLVVVATPPHTHLALASTVLRRGLALYLEKPPVPRLQDLAVLEEQVRPGQRVEVGFQLARRNLAVLTEAWNDGLVGTVQRITAHAALARADGYYARSAWAGRWFLDGTAVLDGPLFNPCAHILHAAVQAATVVCPGWKAGDLSAECYSVRDIDGDDVIALRVQPVDDGPVVVASATTAADEVLEPAITLHGTRGELTVRHRDGEAWLRRDGRHTTIPAPADSTGPLDAAVADPRGEGDALLSLAAMRPYLRLVNAVVEACGTPGRITAHRDRVEHAGDVFQRLPGVTAAIRRVVSEGTLFSENRERWAAAPARMDLREYTHFDHPRDAGVQGSES